MNEPFGRDLFTVFTLVTAPAVLTNACAVMSLTTSNRLARAIDRARELQAELTHSLSPEDRGWTTRRLESVRGRALILTKALGAFQLAFGSFAAATLVALLGAALASLQQTTAGHAALFLSLFCFLTAIFSVVIGATRLVRETRLAYEIIRDDTARLLAQLSEPAEDA